METRILTLLDLNRPDARCLTGVRLAAAVLAFLLAPAAAAQGLRYKLEVEAPRLGKHGFGLAESLAEFEKLSSQETQPEASGFFAKVKDFFGSNARPS